MASGIPYEVWSRNLAEYERRDAKRQHIRRQIMALLPAESDAALSRDDLLRVLLLCQQLDRLNEWPIWCDQVRVAALVRHLADRGVAAVAGLPVNLLYDHDPDEWCDE